MADRGPALNVVAPRRVLLSAVVGDAPDGHEPNPGFAAWLDGARYEVTAVLERTAVLCLADDRWAEKRTARLDVLEVDPDAVGWRRKPMPTGAFRHAPPTLAVADDLAAPRAVSDEPARHDQGRPMTLKGPRTKAVSQEVERGRTIDEKCTISGSADCTSVPPSQTPTVGDDFAAGRDVGNQRLSVLARQPRHSRDDKRKDPGALASACDGGVTDIPVRVHELVDHVIALARYARDLENELDRHRQAAQQLRRQVADVLAAGRG
jgi:hypothetical protein